MYTARLDTYPPTTVTDRGVHELLRLLVDPVRELVPCRAVPWDTLGIHLEKILSTYTVFENVHGEECLGNWPSECYIPYVESTVDKCVSVCQYKRQSSQKVMDMVWEEIVRFSYSPIEML